MSIRDRVSDIVEHHGQLVTFRRVIGRTRNTTTMKTVNSFSEEEVKAHLRKFKPNELEGLIQHGDIEVRIAAKDITNAPTENDKIKIGTKDFNIKSVDTRNDNGVDILHIIQIRGKR